MILLWPDGVTHLGNSPPKEAKNEPMKEICDSFMSC